METTIPADTSARLDQLAHSFSTNVIRCQKTSEDATVPTKAHDSDAGWDLYSSEETIIGKGERQLVKTQICLEIPDDYVGLIWPRSGLAVKQGVDVFAGVVDSGYRGEVGVCLFNSSDKDFHIRKGDRIAQILFQEVTKSNIIEVENLEDSDRGERGFGSSGT